MERMYLGVDLHASQMTVHRIVKGEDGVTKREREQVKAQDYGQFFASLPEGSHVCVEASTSAFEFIRQVGIRAGSVHVVNPQAMKELYCTGRKTDRIDAKKLADRLARHLEEGDKDDGFPEVWIPDQMTQELRKLLSHYDFVNRQLVSTKNRLALVFRQRMIPIETISEDSVRDRFNHPGLSEEDQFSLRLSLDRLILFEKQKAALRAHIEALGVRTYPDQMRLLVSVPGISIFIAAAFLAEVGDINRFPSAQNLSSYLCAAPSVDASGQSCRIGGLRKRGRKRVYRLILQSLFHIVAGNPAFTAYQERTHHGKHVCKVRSALVRRTIVSLFYILKNQEVYRFVNDSLYRRKLKEIDTLDASLAA